MNTKYYSYYHDENKEGEVAKGHQETIKATNELVTSLEEQIDKYEKNTQSSI